MLKLSDLQIGSYRPDHVVALEADQRLTWSHLLHDVTRTRELLRQQGSNTWALFEPDTYRFTVGMLALLSEDMTVFLPGENHEAMSLALVEAGAEFIGEFPSQDTMIVHSEAEIDDAVGRIDELSLTGSIVVYTSGSTGAPKGIVKTLAQIDAELASLEYHWGETLQNCVMGGTVSQQHLYGLLFLVCWPLATGRAFWRRPFVDPAIMARTLAEFDSAAWVMSPAHLHRLGDHMPFAAVREKTAAVFSSGGPLSHAGAKTIDEGLGACPFEVLGSSETGGIAWRQQQEPTAPWSPLTGVELKLDASGGLTVKSPWLEDNNWYVTADQATLHPEGGFSLGARLDRIVKLEGKRVSLPETESALERHSWIQECRVIVLARRRQMLGAVLVLSPEGQRQRKEVGHHLFTRAMRQYLGQHVAAAATPRVWRIAEQLPRNAQGKLVQSAIERLFEDQRLPRIEKQEDIENGCRLHFTIASDNPYFQGHFEEAAVLPGVVQLLWAQQFAIELLALSGDFAGMRKVKFRDLVFPQQRLTLELQHVPGSGELYFHYETSQGRHSQGTLLYEAMPRPPAVG